MRASARSAVVRSLYVRSLGSGIIDQPAPCALGGDKAAVGDTLQICEIIERTLVGGKRQEYGLLEPTR